MPEQTEIGDWDGVDESEEAESSTDASTPTEQLQDREPMTLPDGSTVLFRLTNDPFVNYAAASLATQVGDSVEITSSRIYIPPEKDLDTALTRLRGVVEDALPQTHKRTSLAYSINSILDEIGADSTDSRRIQPPSEPFPAESNRSHTIFDDDTVSPEELEEQGLLQRELADRDIDEDASLYAQSPTYVGTNRADQFPNQLEKFEDTFDAFEQTLRGTVSADDKSCMCCGSDQFPAYDNPVTDEKVEYNQTFAILSSSSGQIRALGTGARRSSHRGRCVACLVAGFYFALMPKIVRQTGSNENDARVFVPVGDFSRLAGISADLYLNNVLEDIDNPVGDDNANSRQRTLGEMQTTAVKMQALDVYQSILRHLYTEYTGGAFDRELEYRPTELMTFVSELGRVRDINQVERISPEIPVYDILAKQQASDSVGEYWPVEGVIRWFAETEGSGTRGLEEAKNTLADGIMNADLEQIRRGVVTIARGVERAGGENTPGYARPHPANLHHFFSVIMQKATTSYDKIDSTAIESIQRVGSGIGRVFSDGDDVSVLINLQNASTQDEFLRAFEKAGMQAQKKSTETPPQQFDASRDDDVATVLSLITDSETFEPAKRMFVIHASLAAQYENSVNSSADAGGDDA